MSRPHLVVFFDGEGQTVVRAQIFFPVPPRIFIEDGIVKDVDARGLRIKEPVRLGPVLLADEDDFGASVVEFGEAWAHLLDVGDTPKHFEEVYRRFLPVPCLVRGLPIEHNGGCPIVVEQEHSSMHCLPPEAP